MSKKITSTSQLPDWFEPARYKKRLSEIDWFREIRRRQIVRQSLDLRPPGQGLTPESQQIMLSLLVTPPVPDSVVFLVGQGNTPIRDLTAGEAIYYRSAIRDPDLVQLGKDLDHLMSSWYAALSEDHDGPTPLNGEHEALLASFFGDLDSKPYSEKMDMPVESLLEEAGNPFLSYRRPLNGWGITVDTQYDDDTLIKYFKNWLNQKRIHEGERARRPFNQNDFDDWEYFKIREIFDLETWARITDCKILDKVLAQAVWPNAPDDFSPIDVLRTTARKKVAEIYTFPIVVRFYGQLLLGHGENFLAQ